MKLTRALGLLLAALLALTVFATAGLPAAQANRLCRTCTLSEEALETLGIMEPREITFVGTRSEGTIDESSHWDVYSFEYLPTATRSYYAGNYYKKYFMDSRYAWDGRYFRREYRYRVSESIQP